MKYNLILLFILCKISFVLSKAKTASNSKTTGPYVNILNRIGLCENPIIPYAKEQYAVLDIGVKNNTIVKGNFTMLGQKHKLEGSWQEMYYIDGKWQTTFFAKSISCRSQWLAILINFLGVQFDKKTCAVPKGSYLFEVDYNKLDHMWTPSRPYGRMLRRFEGRIKSGTFICCEFDSDIKPAH